MIHPTLVRVIAVVNLAGWVGCVSVETPKTKVNVGLPSMGLPGESSADSNATPYARPLHKVSQQQAKVAKYLARREWDDVVKKSSEWIDQVRDLSGYATTSHDPRLFRACCDTLLDRAQALRQAAMRRDAAHAQQAFDACDPPLNQLVRSFPTTHTPSPTGVTARSTAAPDGRGTGSPVRPTSSDPKPRVP